MVWCPSRSPGPRSGGSHTCSAESLEPSCGSVGTLLREREICRLACIVNTDT